MNENIVEIKNLTKIYDQGNVLAVDNITLNIKKGEIFALLGPNGAGKTTTISVLATLLTPSKGEAFVNSYDVKEHPDQVRKSIGIVFQEPSLDNEMKARENLELHAILYHMPKRQRKERISEVLRLVDLEDKAESYVKHYSGGMKRRLEIARGLLHRPKMLFLDEPTLGLDPQTRRKIWDKIKELNNDLDVTILITTHYMDEADELADRICIMDHGKIIALDTSENLKKEISGDIIDIKFEKVEDRMKIPRIISQLRSIPSIKNISIEGAKGIQTVLPMDLNLPKGMPGINPEMIKSQVNQMMSDPNKLLMAFKRFPMASQMFLNAPIDMKKRISNLFTENLLKELPNEIKEEIIKIKRGNYQEEEKDFEPTISISCESGGKCLPEIIQAINNDGLKIKDVNMHAPKLEDVFLHFVGSNIREESSNTTKNIKKFIQMRQLRR
ncbi:MAG: ATP-binding cassette domain-containing protein [Candidatus Heimdallarchaeota archaeon]